MQISKDRKKRLIDLYFNQHKTYAEIAQIEKISPRDIHAIIKEEIARRQKNKDQQQSAEAYKLFSEGKTPVQVAIELNLREPEVTKLYKEYCKLNRRDILNLIDKETNGKLGIFLKLYKQLIKKKGMTIEQIGNVVDTDINRLPHMETLYEQVKDEVDKMQHTIQRLENYSHTLNDEIASAKALLNSYHVLCECKRKEAENLNNEISRLEALVSRFKSNNEEYLKINKIIEEKVSSFLTDGKVLLQFSLASIIETIRRNPDKYNDLLAHNILSSKTTPTQETLLMHNEDYKTMILEESDKLYNELIKELVNRTMSSVNPLKMAPSSSNLQRIHDSPDSYRKEQVYNATGI